MKRLLQISSLIIFFLTVYGCAYMPFVKNIPIDVTPRPSGYTTIDSTFLINGFSKHKVPWIAFSDRAKNYTQVSKQNDADMKQLGFLEPVYILAAKDKIVKVAPYLPSVDLTQTNGCVPKKSLKKYGWISKDKLLLWNTGLKDADNGFCMKAVVAPAGSDVITNTNRYFLNDSILTFNTPSLTDTTSKKMAIGQVVYVYKQSEDKRAYLIGKSPSVKIDSAGASLYGWVSRNIISFWGTRNAVRLKHSNADNMDTLLGIYQSTNNTKCIPATPDVSMGNVSTRLPYQSIFPIINSSDSNRLVMTHFFTHALNYDKNKIYNVLGYPIYYNQAKQFIDNSRKLNVVFSIDLSQNNRLYLPIVKSLMQDLQLYFESPSFFTETKFGVVVYKYNTCGVQTLKSPLSNNYTDIVKFLDDKEANMNCADESIYQPVSQGILNACDLLSKADDQTNLLIQIGTTANEPGSETYAQVINAVSKVKARLIFFQTVAKSADAYNDFVLFAENMVSNTAKNISELKKEKIVNQNDVLVVNDFSLQAGDSGIYRLDYPTKSMSQGYVIFPNKGEVMQASILKKAIDAMMTSIVADNKQIETTLNTYFKATFGINNTEIKDRYTCLFNAVSNPVPTDFAVQLSGHDNPFLLKGYLSPGLDTMSSFAEHGILLTDDEYEKLHDYYNKIYQATILDFNKFKRKKALKRYIKNVKANNPTLEKFSKHEIANAPITFASYMNMGYDNRDTFMLHHKLKLLRKKKGMEPGVAKKYYTHFRTLANKLTANKSNDDVRIMWNGQYFYWLNKDYLPTLYLNNDATE